MSATRSIYSRISVTQRKARNFCTRIFALLALYLVSPLILAGCPTIPYRIDRVAVNPQPPSAGAETVVPVSLAPGSSKLVTAEVTFARDANYLEPIEFWVDLTMHSSNGDRLLVLGNPSTVPPNASTGVTGFLQASCDLIPSTPGAPPVVRLVLNRVGATGSGTPAVTVSGVGVANSRVYVGASSFYSNAGISVSREAQKPLDVRCIHPPPSKFSAMSGRNPR